jgi:hypothetical protein
MNIDRIHEAIDRRFYAIISLNFAPVCENIELLLCFWIAENIGKRLAILLAI